jgi:hypothetical protein
MGDKTELDEVRCLGQLFTRLTYLEGFAEHKEAAKAVAAHMKSKGEDPSEFYCEGVKEEEGMLVFPLSDRAAFKVAGRVMGNPTGRCRDVYYDPRAKKVAKELFWR